jgi:hypothetical protein
MLLFGAGFIAGSRNAPVPVDSELATAQVLAGDRNVRLIGYHCGDHNLTAVARWEDEFPESGCREIRILRDDVEFPIPPKGVSS